MNKSTSSKANQSNTIKSQVKQNISNFSNAMQLLHSFLLFLASAYASADETPNLRGNALEDKDKNAGDNAIREEDDGDSAHRHLREIDCPRSCRMRKMLDNICHEECNTEDCRWDAFVCQSRDADNFVSLTLGTKDVKYAYSSMDPLITLYNEDGDTYEFNLEEYGALPDPNWWDKTETYEFYAPGSFGKLDRTKIKFEATSSDGWCFDYVKLNHKRMDLDARCEGGYCDNDALWLDGNMKTSDRHRAYVGNYAKAESWTLYSWKSPRKSDGW